MWTRRVEGVGWRPLFYSPEAIPMAEVDLEKIQNVVERVVESEGIEYVHSELRGQGTCGPVESRAWAGAHFFIRPKRFQWQRSIWRRYKTSSNASSNRRGSSTSTRNC